MVNMKERQCFKNWNRLEITADMDLTNKTVELTSAVEFEIGLSVVLFRVRI